MSYGKIQETFWDDPTLRGLSHQARYLMLYLLTNRHRNRLGLYVLPPAYAAEDLQWDTKDVESYRHELEQAGRVFWDPTHRCIFVRHYLRHNTLENKNVVLGAVSDMRSLPDTPLLVNLLRAVEETQRDHYLPLSTELQERIRSRLIDSSGNRCGNHSANDSTNDCDTVNASKALSLPNLTIPNHTLPDPTGHASLPTRTEVGTAVVMKANELLAAWVERQAIPPDAKEKAKQAGKAKQICEHHARNDIVAAFIGMGQLYPHSDGTPWDLFDLDKKFSKAKQAAMRHPEVEVNRRAAEIALELEESA